MKKNQNNPVLLLFKDELKRKNNLENSIVRKKAELSNLCKDLCIKVSQEILSGDIPEATRELLSCICSDGRNRSQKLISILVRKSLYLNRRDLSIDYRFPMVKALNICEKFSLSDVENLFKDVNTFGRIKFYYQIYSKFIFIRIEFT